VTRPSFDARGQSDADDAWLEAMLRGAQLPAIDDDGFCTRVLVRVAARPAVLAPAAALEAVRRAQSRERTNMRWTIAGTLVGALVAALSGSHGSAGAVEPDAMLLPGLALLLASTVLAWLAISRS
jgi:hypothetical protein